MDKSVKKLFFASSISLPCDPKPHPWMTISFSLVCAFITRRLASPLARASNPARFIGVLLCFFLSGCCISCNSALSRDAYVAWVRDYDNGLHVKKQFSGYDFDLQYLPSQYVMLQRSGAVTEGQDGQATLQHYTLSVSLENKAADLISHNIANSIEKQQKLYYFSYEFQQDITLEENGKVLPCALFHFEKGSGLSNVSTFVLAFENSEVPSAEATLVISSEHFSALPIKIKISKDNIPSLAI